MQLSQIGSRFSRKILFNSFLLMVFLSFSLPSIAQQTSGELQWELVGRPGGYLYYEPSYFEISLVNANVRFMTIGTTGLLVSEDGGKSWINVYDNLVLLGFNDPNVEMVASSPVDDAVIYAIVSEVVVSSHDFGRTWLSHGISAVSIGVASRW